MTKALSVFFPLFNEEHNVEQAVEKTVVVLQRLNLKYEIIIVDDGSTDETANIAERIAKQNPNIRVIHHPKNLGYGEALKAGFYNAKYDTICYTDGDGQFDFREVSKFLEKIENNDLVIGYRIKRQDPLFRILFKKGWKLSLLTFFGLTLKDVDCGFKMVRKAVLEKIPHLESTRGAMINAELAIKAKKYGFKVTEVGVNHYPRLSGKPTGASLRVILKSYLDLFKLWWKLKDQKLLFLCLLGVLFLASSLRFYKLAEYMTFLGDEGRDMLIVKKILTGLNFPLIGPPTSVGNIYLGPLYYYMMASAAAVFWLNPVAAAGLDALLGVATVGLIYYLGKVWFGRGAGLLSAFLYAISPVAIIYSRSSWNPNPAPFFALLGIWSLYKMHSSGNFRWLALTGAFFASSLQMHYLAVLLVPIAIVLWVGEIWQRKTKGLRLKNIFSGTTLGILSFFLVMSPLFLFDLKHQLLNYRAITTLLTEGSSIKTDILANLIRIPSLFSYNLIGRYIAGENFYLTGIVAALILGTLVLGWRRYPYLVLGVWLLIGLLGVSFYQQSVYDHYLGFLNPTPFLLLGSVLVWKNKWIKFGMIVLIIALTVVNLEKTPLNYPPNNQLQRTQNVAKFIIRESGDKPFNFALLAKNNYDSAYQFYLGEYGHQPKQVPFDKTGQLFVVCEDPCDPIYSPKYEIAAFGWTLVDREWDFAGVKVYKLVHNPEEFKK